MLITYFFYRANKCGNYIKIILLIHIIAKHKTVTVPQKYSWREKYPKLVTLFLSFVLAFALFFGRNFVPLQTFFSSLGYSGTFLAGLLYSLSFTAVPAAAILLLLAHGRNVLFAGLLAGVGALVGDFLFFTLMRGSFSQELHRLARERVIIDIEKKFHHVKRYALMILAGLIIASPLPTEFGVALFSSLKEMTTKRFLILAYLLHTAGIFIILWIGKGI